ncbi:ASF1 like histone chaperone-domain-containing protein [Bombardia bombarda]|uniref:Histone chaperone n=1 Tax=Bombardia bombarda TaxID=252184 RepID=A0AA39X129_9PEZI|nr:ASF1 like histone chaperone-domain-containing protein [Bombardia bombarda]
MSVVSLLGVNVMNNPARFTDKYEFEITFECLEQLEKDLEWKLTYVGSAQSDNYDQELDSLLVGPIPVGVNKFVFEADPPDTKRIPTDELFGVTVILLTCAYDGREFVRVGYYVNNEYDSEELVNDPPAKPVIEKIRRNVLAGKPRVTRFAIKWYQPEADLVTDEDEYGAEELAEEEEEEVVGAEGEASSTGANGVDVINKDAEMAGVESGDAEVAENGVEEDEMSDDGSVDIEGESEDELEEEDLLEGEAVEGDEMEVDSDKPAKAAVAAAAAAADDVMIH